MPRKDDTKGMTNTRVITGKDNMLSHVLERGLNHYSDLPETGWFLKSCKMTDHHEPEWIFHHEDSDVLLTVVVDQDGWLYATSKAVVDYSR